MMCLMCFSACFSFKDIKNESEDILQASEVHVFRIFGKGFNLCNADTRGNRGGTDPIPGPAHAIRNACITAYCAFSGQKVHYMPIYLLMRW